MRPQANAAGVLRFRTEKDGGVVKPFYVYRIFSIIGTIYVGKGSGRRLSDQKRRFGADGEILAEFADEDAAFRAEKRFIRDLCPLENKNPGGAGGRVGVPPAPNGLTPDGLAAAAPHLARLAKYTGLPGVARILANYVAAHGMEEVAKAMRPFMAKDLALQNKP